MYFDPPISSIAERPEPKPTRLLEALNRLRINVHNIISPMDTFVMCL